MLWVFLILIIVIMQQINSFKGFTELDFKEAIQKTNHSIQMKTLIEQMYRLESNNFKSLQYKFTGSPGMESHGENFPYGWTSLKNLWTTRPDLKPVGKKTFMENGTLIPKKFLVFPSVNAGIESLASYLTIYPAGRWYSTDPIKQAEYENKLSKIKTLYHV